MQLTLTLTLTLIAWHIRLLLPFGPFGLVHFPLLFMAMSNTANQFKLTTAMGWNWGFDGDGDGDGNGNGGSRWMSLSQPCVSAFFLGVSMPLSAVAQLTP